LHFSCTPNYSISRQSLHVQNSAGAKITDTAKPSSTSLPGQQSRTRKEEVRQCQVPHFQRPKLDKLISGKLAYRLDSLARLV